MCGGRIGVGKGGKEGSKGVGGQEQREPFRMEIHLIEFCL